MLRRLRVLVDGETVAKLWPGQSADLPLLPGHHGVQGRMDWLRSPVVEVQMIAGATVDVEVSLTMGSWFRAVVVPRRAIRAVIMSTSAVRG